MDISFIIPYYNGQTTIVRCLDSIYAIGLNLNSFEILLIDDCSTLPAEEVLADYICNHNNLKVIRHTENLCQGGAKNTGIRLSVGRYLVFADQDDYIISENMRAAIHKALNSSPDMLACTFRIIFENGSTVEKGLERTAPFSTDGKSFCESAFDPSQSLAPWSYIYSREYLIKMSHPMEEKVLMEDSDWVAWHLVYANTISYLPLPIYYWVMNPHSITHVKSWRNAADRIKFGYRKIRDSREFRKTSESFAEVMKDDGKYNIENTFKKLWKVDKYFLFYKHIGEDVLIEIRQMPWSSMTAFMLNHTKTTSVVLSIIGPILKGAHFFYHKAKMAY